ncbi:MAG: hypothetical protein EA393_01395 [Bacteroidetes bacterium]|nr:MAG: hypothetical protein EA393_01395 [Bacteroidota bacterium]
MKKKTTLPLILALVAGLIISGCQQNKRQEATDLLYDSKKEGELFLHMDMVKEMISSVSNPVEMSSLLQKAGVIYSQDLLNPAGNIDDYNTNFQRALNLGVYGTNLVYMNIYDRTLSTLRYLSNVRQLAADLRIEQFFDYETLNRLSESSRNIDSVLFITNTGFDNMSRYLIEQDRSNIAILISTGTWIESLYIATHVQTIPGNRDYINMRIGEQKKVLDNLLLLLYAYREEPDFNWLFEDLMDLKKIFEDVKISYVYAEPTMQELNGVLIVIDNSMSEVIISDNTIEKIANKVAEIRTRVIG